MIPPSKELSAEELTEILKAKPMENTQSRAVASAMRALQQRIKELESALSSSAKDNEFFQVQLEFCENENRRFQEQYSLDRENWALQVASLKSLGNEENNKKLKKTIMENGAKLEEFKLKSQGEKQQLENTLREKELRGRELEEQNRNLTKLCENHAKKIKQLTAKHKTKGRKRSLSVSKTRALKTSEEDIRVPSTAPSYLKRPPLATQIAVLEQELSELNSDYKSLLLSNSSEFSSLRVKLEEIGSLMEEKSKSLYSLKRKHQEELKAKLAL